MGRLSVPTAVYSDWAANQTGSQPPSLKQVRGGHPAALFGPISGILHPFKLAR